jgi:hypothetical protein
MSWHQNLFRVALGANNDQSVCSIDAQQMQRIEAFRGDAVSVTPYETSGQYKRTFIVLTKAIGKEKVSEFEENENEPRDFPSIEMSELAMHDLGVAQGALVRLALPRLPYLLKVQIVPLLLVEKKQSKREEEEEEKEDQELKLLMADGNSDFVFTRYVQPFFQDAYRPVSVGQIFEIDRFKFVVAAAEPSDGGIVSPDTVIYCEGHADVAQFARRPIASLRNLCLWLVRNAQVDVSHLPYPLLAPSEFVQQ